MMYLISALTIIINLIFSKNKYVAISSGVFLWIGMSFNDVIVDRTQYRRMYANPLKFNEEWGYTYLQLLARKFGLSFQVFFAILIGACLAVAILTIIRNTTNPGFVLALYVIFPYLMDAAQVRSFLAGCIITAIVPLLLNCNLKNAFSYIVGIFIAGLFHYSAYFYLLFLITYFLSWKVIVPLFAIIAFVLMSKIIPLLKIIAKIIPLLGTKIDRYLKPELFTASNEMWAYTIYLIALILLTVVTYLILRNYDYATREQTKKRSISRKLNQAISSDLMLKLDGILLLTLPLISVSVSYDRVIRMMLLTHYIYFSKVFSLKISFIVKAIYLILLLMFVVYYLWFFIYTRFPAAVFWPFFQGNSIF